MSEATTPLLTDLYQLNMIQAYLDHGETKTAVFEFFACKLPPRRGFLVAAGLEQAFEFLENLRFSAEDIDWLRQTGRFVKELLDHLAHFRFTGDVHAMPEGTVFFGNEPILRVTAPLPQSQLAETRLINILHFQSLIASKAVAPPSMHPYGRRYAWMRGHSPADISLAPLPRWLIGAGGVRAGRSLADWRSLVREGVTEGQRNSTLASLAGHLLWHGVDPAVTLELLLAWNRVRCRPPPDDAEAAQVVRNIVRLHDADGTDHADGRPAPGASEIAVADRNQL